MIDLQAEFTGRILLGHSLNNLCDSGMKKFVDVMLFVFVRLSNVIDWLDVNVNKKAIAVDINWIF